MKNPIPPIDTPIKASEHHETNSEQALEEIAPGTFDFLFNMTFDAPSKCGFLSLFPSKKINVGSDFPGPQFFAQAEISISVNNN